MMGKMAMISFCTEFAIVGPIVSDGAFVAQILNEIAHLFLNLLRHFSEISEHFSLDDDVVHFEL